MSNTFIYITEKYKLLNKLKAVALINDFANRDSIIDYLFSYTLREYASLHHAYNTDSIFVDKFINRFYESLTSNIVNRIQLVGEQSKLSLEELEVLNRSVNNQALGTSEKVINVEKALHSIAQQVNNVNMFGKYRAYFEAVNMKITEGIKPFIDSFNNLFSAVQHQRVFNNNDNDIDIDLMTELIEEHNNNINAHNLINIEERLSNLENIDNDNDSDIDIDKIKELIKEHNDDLNDNEFSRHKGIHNRITSYIQDIENIKGRLNNLENANNSNNIDIRFIDVNMESSYSAYFIRFNNIVIANFRQRDGNNSTINSFIPYGYRPIEYQRVVTQNGYINCVSSGQVSFSTNTNASYFHTMVYKTLDTLDTRSLHNLLQAELDNNNNIINNYERKALRILIDKELKSPKYKLDSEDMEYMRALEKINNIF